MTPPPYITVPDWADRFRKKAAGAGSTIGQWRTGDVEIARGPMLAITEPGVSTITVMVCTQLMKTARRDIELKLLDLQAEWQLDRTTMRSKRGVRTVDIDCVSQRLTIGQTFGVSGDRTDQMFARLPAAIATNAGILQIWGGINNIGAVASGSPAYTYTHAVTGETVTINTVAAVTMRDLRQMAETARAAGMAVIIENEIGGSTITTTEKLAALNSLRQMIAEYGEVTPGIYVHDAFPAVMQPGAATPTFKPGYSYDGIHYSGRGAYWHAKSEAPLVDRLTAPRSVLIRSAMEVPANGRRQLLTNPIFATTTGGTAGNGITGDVPSGWTAAMGTNVGSASLSSVTNADGVGNGVQAAITYNAAGSFSMTQTLSGNSGGAYNANLQPGDEVEGFALVEITGASSALSTISLELTGSTAGAGGTAFGAMDLTGPNSSSDQGVNDTALITLRTRPVVLPSPTGTFPYLIAAVRATAFTAGSATIVVRQIGVRRRGS